MPFRSPLSPRPESNPALTRNPGRDRPNVTPRDQGRVLSCVSHPLCPTMSSETLTSCWTTSGSTRCAWRATDAESADRVTLIRDLLGHGSCLRKLTDSPLQSIRVMSGYGTVAFKRHSGRYVAARGRGARKDAAFLLSWFEIGVVLIVEGAKVARRNSGNLSASVSETRSRHSSRP
jgi:hypothetical protein